MAPKYKDMPCVGGYLDGSKDGLKAGTLNILAGKDKAWGHKRIACIQTSDNRREDHADLGKHSSWVKWASPTAEALRQACLAQESRISDTEPSVPSVVITSISVQNSSFLGPLELAFAALKDIKEDLDGLASAVDRKETEEFVMHRANWLAAKAANVEQVCKIAEARSRSTADQEDLDAATEAKKEADREADKLQKQLAEHAANSGVDRWQKIRDSSEKMRFRSQQDLDRRIAAAGRLEVLCRHLPREDGDALAAYCSAMAELKASGASDAVAAAEASLSGRSGSITGRLEQLGAELADKVAKKRERIADLKALAGHGEQGGFSYLAQPTRHLMRTLQSAGMDPRPLCDLIEVTDEKWTAAAEALIGRDREAIFVDRADIRRASEIFKDGRREFRGASLVSINKLSRDVEHFDSDKFPSVIHSDDQDAMAFIVRRFGGVRLAETMDAFDRPGRALMTDGLYDNSLTRYHLNVDPAGHKIGKVAQARLAEQIATELKRETDDMGVLESQYRVVSRSNADMSIVAGGERATVAELVSEVASAKKDKREAEEHVQAIQAEGDGGLKERFDAQKAFARRREEEIRSIGKRMSLNNRDIQDAEDALRKGSDVVGSWLNLAYTRNLYRGMKKRFAYFSGADLYRQRLAEAGGKQASAPGSAAAAAAASAAHRALAAAAASAAKQADQDRERHDRSAVGKLNRFFSDDRFGRSSQVGAESPLLGEVMPWVKIQIEAIESNELRQHREKAKEASEKVSSLFRGEFLHAVTERITKMRREIDDLNAALRPHPFVDERYYFTRTRGAEFEPLFKAVELSKESEDSLALLFADEIPEDSPHYETLTELREILEDPDRDFSLFEDYRNFYNFEIMMENIHTGRKTRWEARRQSGSGGEKQLPLYVAIGASLASVFGSVSPHSEKGMALALFDEAFSKMDGKNQRQMFRYFEKLGIQVIIAAPFEKKGPIVAHMDTVVEVDKFQDQSTATVVSIKERVREEIDAVNPDLMDDARVRELMAAE